MMIINTVLGWQDQDTSPEPCCLNMYTATTKTTEFESDHCHAMKKNLTIG
jgi:hypothetical protein